MILAAGFGRRFGSDKRLFRLADGRTLLQATVHRYSAVYPNLCVIVRPEDTAVEQSLQDTATELRIIHAAKAELGMGHSLAAGVRAIAGDWQWASVALGDMPFVVEKTLRELLDRFFSAGSSSIVQPTFEGRPGHPVTFPARCFDKMAALEGDQGARQILAGDDRVIRHPVNDAGVLEDLDVPP